MSCWESSRRSPQAGATGAGRRPFSRMVGIAASMGAMVALSGCRLSAFGQDPGATSQAGHENHIYQGFVLAGIAVGVVVLVLILWPVVFHRRKSDDEMPKQFFEHIPLEIVYTVIPILIVVVLFVATVVTEDKVDAVSPHPAVAVDVYAYQWGWQFAYPDHVSVSSGNVILGQTNTYPTLVLPVGETTRINLRSRDVVHGFYVRDFNFSRYAQPGVLNTFDLTVNRAGFFIGQCTQFCGLHHDQMLFRVEGMTPSNYQAWFAHQRQVAAFSSPAPSVAAANP